MTKQSFKISVYNQAGVGFDLPFPDLDTFVHFLMNFTTGAVNFSSSEAGLNHYIYTVASEIAVKLADEVRKEATGDE